MSDIVEKDDLKGYVKAAMKESYEYILQCLKITNSG